MLEIHPMGAVMGVWIELLQPLADRFADGEHDIRPLQKILFYSPHCLSIHERHGHIIIHAVVDRRFMRNLLHHKSHMREHHPEDGVLHAQPVRKQPDRPDH